jgi:hypothetical protein
MVVGVNPTKVVGVNPTKVVGVNPTKNTLLSRPEPLLIFPFSIPNGTKIKNLISKYFNYVYRIQKQIHQMHTKLTATNYYGKYS